jgi:imidazolonepropionase-like amidohydrolase/cyclophilin family peptidyl-prolyl cis-trans isomerase
MPAESRHVFKSILHLAVCLLAPVLACSQTIAIDGATIIDGNGEAPVRDGIVVISGSRITAVGPRASVRVPPGATVIDAKGRYVVPGFIDTNVHLSLYGGAKERYESLVRYQPRQNEIVLEAAQLDLRHGVTTVRDSYGMLVPLTQMRDSIAKGDAVGARIQAAGNIVGWGGPYSISFSLTPERDLTLFQEQMNDYVTQGAGENLNDLTPEELRIAINKYLDKGPDFIKYGGTSHFSLPTYIGFSPEAQRVMVDEAHKRGRGAETHSTTIEGLRLSILAGIDLIQHPEVLTPRPMPDDLIRLIKERKVIGSMLVSTMTGEAWTKHLKAKEDAQKKFDKAGAARTHTPTFAEERRQAVELGADVEMRRQNAQKLIHAGCLLTPGTDSYWGAAPEFAREPKPETQDHGTGTILAIEGLVELGMTPAQAIVAGTKNGAIACRKLNDYGTLEAGKLADLLILDADPLSDIHNIRKLKIVMKEGRMIDFARLPEKRVLSGAPEVYRVKIETTKGSFVMEVNRGLAPLGADRFYHLVQIGFYDNSRFYRAITGRFVQFGIAGDPAVASTWRNDRFPDDPVRASNIRGTFAFAMTGPDTRTTQIYINTGDQLQQDAMGFAPFGKVVEGMDVVDKLYQGYGERSGGGMRAGKQDKLFEEGNAYLDREFPLLDKLLSARIVTQPAK